MPDDPFSAEQYVLQSCTLGALMSNADADFVSRQLAKIDPWRSLGYSSEGLCRYFLRKDPALSRYLVFVNNRKAGIVCVRYPWLRGAYIEMIGLSESFQGMGIGREVIGWIEAQTLAASQNIWAMVSAFNKRAISFYERAGFVKIAPVHDLIRRGEDEILYRKPIF